MLAKRLNTKLPRVVIFGRANVGKSTLFNRLLENRRALVSPRAGTTRDANISPISWQGREFTLVDTGGMLDLDYLQNPKKLAVTIDQLVQKQARQFLTRANLILFLVDNKSGLLPQDRQINQLLKKHLPDLSRVILVANKVDSAKQAGAAAEFYQLGLSEPQLISAASGAGTGDLLDLIINRLSIQKHPAKAVAVASDKIIKVCILGKPNVGKSSLINSILGYNRVIVSPLPHTTREPQDTDFEYREQTIKLIDTAGISKRGQKSKGLEQQGIDKSLRALKTADIILLVVEINQELTHQDAKLVQEIFEQRKSLIIVANKWDLVSDRDVKTYTQHIYSRLPFAQFVPIQFMSAKNRTKLPQLLNLILQIAAIRKIVIEPLALQQFINYCVKKHLPTKSKGQRYPRIRQFIQTNTNPPEFMVKIGAKEHLAESYLNFLQNQLRSRYKLIGTPLHLWIKKNPIVHGKANS